jgi:hypothetical protein
MSSNGNEWPQALTDAVTDLWKKTRLSAKQIGEQVGKTRNAVLGKIGRLGLLKTTNRDYRNNHSRKAARREPSPPAVLRSGPGRRVFLPSPGAPVHSLNVPFMETRYGQCRYMAGDERICCGQPTVFRGSWCADHYRMVFRHGS